MRKIKIPLVLCINESCAPFNWAQNGQRREIPGSNAGVGGVGNANKAAAQMVSETKMQLGHFMQNVQ